jgi:hypothetical protein
MKGIADALPDLGGTVADHTFVLHVLYGLRKKYDHLKTYLKWARPFPSFRDVSKDLLLDITLGVEAVHSYFQQLCLNSALLTY